MHRVLSVCAIVILTLTGTATAQGAAKGPVKIFILAGQNAMRGYGLQGDLSKPTNKQQATLAKFVKDPKNADALKTLTGGPKKNESGWTVRDDVFVAYKETARDKTVSWKHGGSEWGQ